MATELQHTQGPWSIFDHADATRINIRGANEEFVADCADGFYSDEADEWVMSAESYPNALLIAAAPDMLDALRAAEIAVDQLCIGQDPANQCWVTLGEIRSAIAKASGQ